MAKGSDSESARHSAFEQGLQKAPRALCCSPCSKGEEAEAEVFFQPTRAHKFFSELIIYKDRTDGDADRQFPKACGQMGANGNPTFFLRFAQLLFAPTGAVA